MREGRGKETMKQMRKIENSRDAQLLFLLCWFAYFTSYIGRLNYSSAMTAMIQEAVLTKSQAGFISMVYFFAYGIGQFCNGMLGDRFHPGKMIFAGLAIAAGANLCMGFVGGFGAMAVVWGINGYAQAMIWPPVIRIFAEMVSRERKMKFCVNIVSSQVVGTLASYLLAAVVMWLIGWRAVFGAAAICLCVMSVIWIIGFEKIEKCGKDQEEETADVDNAESTAAKTANTGKQAWLGFGILMVLFPVIIHGMLKDGVTTWIPTYITETFLTSPAFSILVTTVLPIVNLTGAYLAQYVYQKCKKQEAAAAVWLFLIAVLALTGIWIGKDTSMILTIVLFAMTTASMMGVNTIFVNFFPLRYEAIGKVSTVSGFMNGMAYVGTAVSTFTIGVLVEQKGWNVTIGSWVVMTFLALVVCVLGKKEILATDGISQQKMKNKTA